MAEGGGIGRNFGDTVGMFFFFFSKFMANNKPVEVGRSYNTNIFKFTLHFVFWRFLEGVGGFDIFQVVLCGF